MPEPNEIRFDLGDDTEPILVIREGMGGGVIIWRGHEVETDSDLIAAFTDVVRGGDANTVLLDRLEVAKEKLRRMQIELDRSEAERMANCAGFREQRELRKKMWVLFDKLREIFDDLDPPEAAIVARRVLDEGVQPMLWNELERALQKALSAFLAHNEPNTIECLQEVLDKKIRSFTWLPKVRVKLEPREE